MADLTTVARPYAKAAFEYAVDSKAVARWSEMLDFCAAVAADSTMQTLFASGERPAKMADMFLAVVADRVDGEVANLIRAMADNGRLPALPELVALFEEHKAELEKVAEVIVRSPAALSSAQEQQIAAAMEKRLGRKVKLTCNIDPALIGGVVIQAGDTVIDGSVRGKLERLTETLQA